MAWYFDHADMGRAKEMLGDIACIMGNVPTSLLMVGKSEVVKKHCRKLIEIMAKVVSTSWLGVPALMRVIRTSCAP